MRSQCDHLVTPGIPEIGEAMNHNNQWSLAKTGIMDFYSVIIRISMYYICVDVVGVDGSCRVLHLSFLSLLSLCGRYWHFSPARTNPIELGLVSVYYDTVTSSIEGRARNEASVSGERAKP